jgi:predicted DNA-binding transcriptional regulator YafY
MKKKELSTTVTRPMLARLFYIDREIASGTYPNTRTLAKGYEVGTATISRDIDFMRDMMGAPIDYDAAHRGLFYTDKEFRLTLGQPSHGDLVTLGLVKNLLAPYKNAPVYRTLARSIDALTASLAEREGSRWFEDRIVTPPQPEYAVDDELWDVLTAGLKENRVVTFLYQGTWDEDYAPRRVQPYQLIFDNGLWYLYGHAVEREAIRIFSLARMRDATVTDETFLLEEGFDYRVKYDETYFGVLAGNETSSFRITFYEEAMAWVQERVWASDQKIVDDGGSVTITFTSSQYQKVLEWVLSRGGDALPHEPAELVRDWHDAIQQMSERSKKWF